MSAYSSLTFRPYHGSGSPAAVFAAAAVAWMAVVAACAQPPAGDGKDDLRSPTPPSTGEREPRRVRFATGVLIDWSVPLVEMEAIVVLRQGALELFACSPQTREHESILCVRARPRDVFHAMGLIGLESGNPIRYDAEKNVWHPPAGAKLSLRVEYQAEGKTHIVPASEWLVDVETKKTPKSLEWIFSGSRTFGSGRFGADADGTVVCVVDFDTALIAAAGLHSAENESLWLVARTDRIPPVGTPCKLLISAARTPAIVVDLMPGGVFILRRNGKQTTPQELAGLLERGSAGQDRVQLTIEPAEGVPDDAVDRCIDALVKAGIQRSVVEVRRDSVTKEETPSTSTNPMIERSSSLIPPPECMEPTHHLWHQHAWARTMWHRDAWARTMWHRLPAGETLRQGARSPVAPATRRWTSAGSLYNRATQQWHRRPAGGLMRFDLYRFGPGDLGLRQHHLQHARAARGRNGVGVDLGR